jgi:hypothetical protein
MQWVPGAAVKRRGYEADHFPVSSAGVKEGGGLLPIPRMSSWHRNVRIKTFDANYWEKLMQCVQEPTRLTHDDHCTCLRNLVLNLWIPGMM